MDPKFAKHQNVPLPYYPEPEPETLTVSVPYCPASPNPILDVWPDETEPLPSLPRARKG